MSADRAHGLWRQARLQVPRRRPRRRVASGRPRPVPPTGRNHVWAYDFVFDWCANGQRLKCLTVVDEWTRECLAIDVGGNESIASVLGIGKSRSGEPTVGSDGHHAHCWRRTAGRRRTFWRSRSRFRKPSPTPAAYSANILTPSGRGISLINELMDHVQSADGGARGQLRKKKAPDRTPASR